MSPVENHLGSPSYCGTHEVRNLCKTESPAYVREAGILRPDGGGPAEMRLAGGRVHGELPAQAVSRALVKHLWVEFLLQLDHLDLSPNLTADLRDH